MNDNSVINNSVNAGVYGWHIRKLNYDISYLGRHPQVLLYFKHFLLKHIKTSSLDIHDHLLF